MIGALVLGGLFVVLVAAETCPSEATLDGDRTVVRSVERLLEARGVTVGAPNDPPNGCEPLRIHLAVIGRGIRVDRPGGRRIAEDEAQAATIVESWVRRDLTEPLLAGALPPKRPFVPEAPDRASSAELASKPAEGRSFALGLGSAAGVANDGSIWGGLDLSGCVRVSLVCVGGRFRYGFDRGAGGDSKDLETDRQIFDLTAFADVSIDRVGPFTFVLGAGLGLGLSYLERTFDGHRITDDTGGLRVRAQLGARLPLSASWALRLDVEIDYSPFAQQRVFEGLTEDGPNDIPLAAEPHLIGWLVLALELGGF